MVKLSIATREFFRRRKPPAVLWRMGGYAFIRVLNLWMSSLHFRMARYEAEADPADVKFAGPVIFVFWHEYIPFPIYTRPHCRLAMLLSQHQDAEILSHVASFAGLDVVRGSTNRGGTAALRELIHCGKGMSLAITPDGPRGPRRKLAAGCVYLASRLQIPIVPIGFGYDRPWRNKNSWDHFAFPRPGSRARAVLGPRIWVPADLEKDQVELHRGWVEQRLNELTCLAEDWAESKCMVSGSEVLVRSAPRCWVPRVREVVPKAAPEPEGNPPHRLRVAG